MSKDTSKNIPTPPAEEPETPVTPPVIEEVVDEMPVWKGYPSRDFHTPIPQESK